MKRITRQTCANEAPEKWLRQYPISEDTDADKLAKRRALLFLGFPVDPDRVDEIIGNTSWTFPGSCDECGKEPDVLIQVGQEPDYESATADICIECLTKALALAQTK